MDSNDDAGTTCLPDLDTRPTRMAFLSLGTSRKYRLNTVHDMSYSVPASLASSVGTCGDPQEDMDALSGDSKGETGDLVSNAGQYSLFAPRKSRRAVPWTNRPLMPNNTRRHLCFDGRNTHGLGHLATVRRFHSVDLF